MKKRTAARAAAPKPTLPPDVLASDLKYPTGALACDVGSHGTLTFYLVEGRKGVPYWVLTTLRIGGGRGHADRTYAITLEGSIVTVGKGPHVKQTVTIYVAASRQRALQRYVDLYVKGMTDANQIRDRVSSRRAQGQLERAAGNYSWKWNT